MVTFYIFKKEKNIVEVTYAITLVLGIPCYIKKIKNKIKRETEKRV